MTRLLPSPISRSTIPWRHVRARRVSSNLMWDLKQYLSEISGFPAVSLQPVAGAQGEFAGLLIMRAYHMERGDSKRTKIIIPDSAHGTNPASVAAVGFSTIEIKSNAEGIISPEAVKAVMSNEVAGMMMTNPNTLGLFERNVKEIADIVHAGGGLMYMDGANLNAAMGIFRPGDVGFDIMHFNLHKTFSTPHGGGGPGAGAVGVRADLAKYLPIPVLELDKHSRKPFLITIVCTRSGGCIRSTATSLTSFGHIPILRAWAVKG